MHLAVFSYGHLERLKLLVFFNHIRLGSKRLSNVLTSTWKSWSTVSSVPPRAREGNAESDEASSEPPAVSPPASWRGPSLHSRFIFCLRAPAGWEGRRNEGGRARTHTAERESLSRLQARNEQTVTPVPRPARPPLKLKLRSSKTESGSGRIASGGGREIPTRFRKGTEGDGKVERGKRDTAQTLPSRGAVWRLECRAGVDAGSATSTEAGAWKFRMRLKMRVRKQTRPARED